MADVVLNGGETDYVVASSPRPSLSLTRVASDIAQLDSRFPWTVSTERATTERTVDYSCFEVTPCTLSPPSAFTACTTLTVKQMATTRTLKSRIPRFWILLAQLDGASNRGGYSAPPAP